MNATVHLTAILAVPFLARETFSVLSAGKHSFAGHPIKSTILNIIKEIITPSQPVDNFCARMVNAFKIGRTLFICRFSVRVRDHRFRKTRIENPLEILKGRGKRR
jgi:hypothetical protein